MLKALGALVVIAFVGIVTGLAEAFTMGKLWSWFVAHEYGAGPSMGAWFGIATILAFIIKLSTIHLQTKKASDDDLDELLKKLILQWVGVCFGCATLLGLSWLTGAVLGWMH